MTDRQRDERHLAWLMQRHNGRKCGDIADDHGVSVNDVSSWCARILQADLEFSGEREGSVRAAYW